MGTTIIIVSQIAHNIYLLIGVLVIVGGGVYLYLRRRNNGPSKGNSTPAESVEANNDGVDTSPPQMT
jgi:LPXTG-motif cell wall-anchored protein